jgi:large subunit ribosomal protein L32
MGVPKRKMSKMKKRLRKAANRYEGVLATYCSSCSAPARPHRVCPACGSYKGKQVIAKSE